MRWLPKAFLRRDAVARKAAQKLGLELERNRLDNYTIYDSNNQDVVARRLSLTGVEDRIRNEKKMLQMPQRKRVAG